MWDAARQVETEMRSAMVVAERIAQAALGDSSRGVNQYQRQEHLIREFDDDRHVQAMVVDRKNEVVSPPDPLRQAPTSLIGSVACWTGVGYCSSQIVLGVR